MAEKELFKWRHYEKTIILMAVRWYLRYGLSYRDVEELLMERGVKVDHTTIYRWVHRYAPEIEKRTKRYLKPTNDSYRVDETYIKGEVAMTVRENRREMCIHQKRKK